jgi:hypothetical protein
MKRTLRCETILFAFIVFSGFDPTGNRPVVFVHGLVAGTVC